MKTMIKEFQNPSAKYRPTPLWVWNDKMSKQQINFQLTELATHGFGGAFVHPRPGLVTEYMSDEWFEMWEYALEKAKALGIKLNIYDENSYPSGFGGGLVSSKHPEALLTLMRLETSTSPESVQGEYVTAFAVTEKDGKFINAINLSHLPKEEWKQYGEIFLTVIQEKPEPSGWMAGFAYVDLLRPQVTDTFLQCTHEAYYERFGDDFGKTITAIFTDEPSVSNSGPNRLAFSYWFAYEFKKRNGYDLIKHLPCVFVDVEGDFLEYPATKIRFDYYDTIHELWTKNSIEKISNWCEAHNVNWTGHYFEHEWPHVGVYTSPSVQSNYEFHQWPAIDMLLSNYLRDTPVHALTHTIRELKSAVNQFAKERSVCELYGAGGWDSNFEDYKRMGDWVLVNGVNFINQHLTYSTLMGARKHDHPQSFDWRSAWWNEYKLMNDYFGRASYMLSQGRMEQRILVLNPSTTSYLTEPSKEEGTMFSNPSLDCIKEPNMTQFLTLCQYLSNLQWDYDLGDEYTLQRHAKARNGKLQVVKQNYDCVIVSGSMKNMLSSTVKLLKACAKNGVKIYAVDNPGYYVDGREAKNIFSELNALWKTVDLDQLDKTLSGILKKRIKSTVPFPIGFEHIRRKLNNGDEVWFFTNLSMNSFETTLYLQGNTVKQFELFSGNVTDIIYEKESDWLSFPLKLVRNQSLMLYVTNESNTLPCKKNTVAQYGDYTQITTSLCAITRESENIMPISYADYQDKKKVYVKRLCDQIFRERGFQSNPWDNKVQYKDNILNRNATYNENSGFTITYHFTTLKDFIPKKLEVVVEHPELCHLKVNGKDVVWIPNATYLDHHFGVADITEQTTCGDNTIEVIVDVFNVLMEIDTIYLKGEFGVQVCNEQWILAKEQALDYGSWRKQGMPFYPYAVNYEYRFTIDSTPTSATIDLAHYDAIALSFTINGKPIGLLHADGKREQEIAECLKVGENTLNIRVCGSFKNLFGPHFVNTRGSAWPTMWKQSPKHEPSATSWDLLNFGLNTAPIIKIK